MNFVHTLSFALFVSVSVSLFTQTAHAQTVPSPPSTATSPSTNLQLAVVDPDSRSTELRLVEEGLVWTGTAGLAVTAAVSGVFLGFSDGEGGTSAGRQAGSVTLASLGFAIGVFGIPATVWLTGGMRGGYGYTLLGNLAGAAIGGAIFAAFYGIGSAFESDAAFNAFLISGAVVGGVVNLAGALLGEHLSRPDGSDRVSARIVPSIAPTANFDGVTFGMGGAF